MYVCFYRSTEWAHVWKLYWYHWQQANQSWLSLRSLRCYRLLLLAEAGSHCGRSEPNGGDVCTETRSCHWRSFLLMQTITCRSQADWIKMLLLYIPNHCRMAANVFFFLLSCVLHVCITLRVDKGHKNVIWPLQDKPEHPQVVELCFERADVPLHPGFSSTLSHAKGQHHWLSSVWADCRYFAPFWCWPK